MMLISTKCNFLSGPANKVGGGRIPSLYAGASYLILKVEVDSLAFWGQIWGRICPEIWGQIWGFTKFGDEFVPKFEDKFGDSPNLGKKFPPNLRTNLGNHQIWGRICPESWGLIWGFTKFGDEFVPKFEDKFGDSPILGTNLSLKLGKNLVFSQNLGKNSPINEGTN